MKIRGHVEELRQQMLSPEFVRELSRDSKSRGRFNETLMGLLLQLDTIQVRKQLKCLECYFSQFAFVQNQLDHIFHNLH